MNNLILIQQILMLLGFAIPDSEREQGQLGPATRAALRRVQEWLGLAVTGEPDRTTLAVLPILIVQHLLILQGYRVNDDEHWAAKQGDSTTEALVQFQADSGLERTGQLDDATWNALLERAGNGRFVVTGTISDSDGQPVTSGAIQALDLNAATGAQTSLGRTRPAADGRYTIAYSVAQLRDLPKLRADLLITLQTGGATHTSDVVRDARPVETIDLVIPAAQPEPEGATCVRLVSGQVSRADGPPQPGALVRAFHEDDRGPIRLGEDTTDGDGRYTIRYELPGVQSIHLRVAVIGADGRPLASSPVVPDAAALEVIDLVSAAPPAEEQSVEGRVLLQHGLPAENVTLRLYRRDFGGQATLLSETTTVAGGRYALGYDPGGRSASLEVRAVDAAGNETALSKPLNFVRGARAALNLAAPAQLAPPAAEYQRLAGDLTPVVGEMARLATVVENAQQQDLTVLNRDTGWDARLIALAATSERLAAQPDVALPHEALYGLLRAGLPSDRLLLAQIAPDVAEQALTQARQVGIVALDDDTMGRFKEQFAAFADRVRLAVPAPGSNTTYGDILQLSGLSADAQAKFAAVYLAHRASDGGLWDKVKAAGLADDDISALQRQGKLAFLVGNSLPLLKRLMERGVDDPAELVEEDLYEADKWRAEIEAAAAGDAAALAALIPTSYTGEKVEERLDAYAADMARKVRLAYPTQVLARAIDRDESDPLKLGAARQETADLLKSAAAQGFRLGQTPVHRFFADNQGLLGGPEALNDGQASLKKLHRLYQITPDDEAMTVLAALNVTSAYDVTAYNAADFAQLYDNKYFEIYKRPPRLGTGRQIHTKATQVSSLVYNLFTVAKTMAASPSLPALSGPPAVQDSIKNELIKHFPTMESLFGSMDFCECEHCRSVLSPAAYLVDLLQFLDVEPEVWGNFLAQWKERHGQQEYPHRDATGKFMTPYDALIERRPDLPHIPLTCENTHTALPYIDLVNEVLEYYVANGALAPGAARDTGEATTAELLAEPQNVIREAYETVRAARYPLTLPFDLWLATVREFSDAFETPLHRILETFRPGDELLVPTQPYDRATVFIESLGLSPAEAVILTDPDPLDGDRWQELYGFPARPIIAAPTNAGQATLSLAETDAALLGAGLRCATFDVAANAPRPETLTITAIGGPASGGPGRRLITFDGVWADPPAGGDRLLPDAAFSLGSAKTLARRLGVSYKEVVEIVRAGFVNPHLQRMTVLHKLGLTIQDAQTGRDPANQALYEANKDLLDRPYNTLSAAEKARFDLLSEADWQTMQQVQAYEARLAAFLEQFKLPPGELEAALQDIPLGDILVLDQPDGCNFDQTTLRYADGRAVDAIALLRINLFVRLWRALGWTLEETDRALVTFTPSAAPFDAAHLAQQPLQAALLYLAHLKTLNERLRVGKGSRLKLISLWADIGATGKKSLYAQLFLTRAALKSGEAELVPDAGEPFRASLFDHPLGDYLTTAGLEGMAALARHRASLGGVSAADAIAPADFAGEPNVTVEYDPLGEVQTLIYRGLLDEPTKAQLAGLSASPALPPLLDAVQAKGRAFSLIDGHRSALQGALGLTAAEIDLILSDAGHDPATAPLTLANASLLYRYGLLAKGLKRPVGDLIALKRLSGLNPFTPLSANPPATLADDHPFSQTLAFVDVAEAVKESGLSVADLEYLLLHHFDATGKHRPDTAGTLTLLKTLADGSRAIQAEHAAPAAPGLLSDEALGQKLGLALPADVAQRLLAMLSDTAEFTAVTSGVAEGDALNPATFAATPAIVEARYNAARQEQKLTYRGVLFAAGQTALQDQHNPALSPAQRTTFAALLTGVREQARAFFDKHLQKQAPGVTPAYGFLDAADYDLLFDPAFDLGLPPAATPEEVAQERARRRRVRLTEAFLPFLRVRLARQFVLQTVAAATGADPALVESLLTDARLLALPPGATPLLDALTATAGRGLDAAFFDSADLSGAAQASAPVVATADTALKDARDPDGNPLGPAGSARFQGYVEVPAAGAYRFHVVLDKAGAAAELRFDHLPKPVFLSGAAGADGAVLGTEPAQFLELKPGLPYRFTLAVTNLNGGGARLLVQGETLPRDRLSQLALTPLSALQAAEAALTLLSKALTLLQELGLSEREARYLLTHAAEFGNVNLSELPTAPVGNTPAEQAAAAARFEGFLRLAAYARLKRDLGAGADDLIAIFEANGTTGADKLDALVYPLIARLTRRDPFVVKSVARALFVAPDFANEAPLQRLWQGLQIVERIGVPVGALLEWTGIVSRGATAEQRFRIAGDTREAIRARFEPEAWQRLAQPIFDRLRQRQRDALVAHVLHTRGFERPEQLFEYFLIDPGMEPVVQTSRIRLAIGAVQVFIHRCLLNLEANVHPSAIINAEQWEWMKRYRVWEANRKIFLFPENWLEPEFRDDKTHLFAELEGALLQGDVSRDLAEDAFLNYLKKLDELARLDIVAMHLEDKADPAQNTLHVIGRTFAQPHKYFYRRYAHRMWTPWEPVSAEIEGDHLAPVIWRDRLYLFWVTFLEKPEPSTIPATVNTDSQIPIPSMVLKVEAHLHWSEYVGGEWTTRQSSDFTAPSPLYVRLGDKGGLPQLEITNLSAKQSALGVGAALNGVMVSGLAQGFKVNGGNAPPAFRGSDVFIHVAKEPYENGEERGVYIHLGQPFGQAFYLAGRNSTPEYATFQAGPANPYSTSSAPATRYRGGGALTVKFAQKIKTEIGGGKQTTSNPQTILQQGHSFTLLPTDNNITLGPPDPATLDADNTAAVAAAIQSGLAEITSLMKPVFYQDNAHTLFIEPTVAEQTTEQTEWVTQTPLPEPKTPPWLIKPELFEKYVAPAYVLPWDLPEDPRQIRVNPAESLINVTSGVDWVTNAGTAVLFDDQLIGPSGQAGLAILPAAEAAGALAQGGRVVNVHAASGLAADSVVVHTGETPLALSGLTQTAGALNVITGGGLNTALAENFDALQGLGGLGF